VMGVRGGRCGGRLVVVHRGGWSGVRVGLDAAPQMDAKRP
jgi:hypothetical protein